VKLLIKGGMVLDPAAGTAEKKDVLIVDGKIAAVDRGLSRSGARVLDAAGKLVAPGFIDMHAHLREPGYTHKETIVSGSRAAVRGGFTAVACMPNTDPVADCGAVVAHIKSEAAKAGLVRVYPIGAITRGSLGLELAEMADLKEHGAVAVSDDGRPVGSAALMRSAMQYARMLGLTVISHCEDESLSAGGAMNEGFMSTVLGLKGIPAAAEEVMVARDLILAGQTGCRLHLAHVSTAGSVRLIREAKARGVSVTAEAAPHHFTLTEEAVAGYDTNTKVNPPLRTSEDVAAVREGLADGTIDVIATDHAPHALEEKDVEYDRAPFGIAGLETAAGLVWSELVNSGVLTPLQAVARLTLNPARVLGIPGGTLETGADADLTIIDPELTWTVDASLFESKGKNTPFNGRLLKGVPVATIVGGRIVMSGGKI
jgi:dihydroorotase